MTFTTEELERIEFERTFFQKMINSFREKLGEEFEKCLRVMPEPPVKGDITAGKLKWRGIRLIHKMNADLFKPDEYWIEQRGKKISPTYTFGKPFEFKL